MEINIEDIKALVLDYAPKLVLGIVLLIIGLWIIGKISRVIRRALDSSLNNETLAKFLTSVAGAFMKIILLLTVAGQVGIPTTSFIAIFGALMVGVGMALNGTIGHFASGVMLMIFRPFNVGDLVTIADGQTGTVDAINVFNTTLLTLDNKKIIVGNSSITDGTIVNISGQGTIGVELLFGIGYNDNIDDARKIILETGASCPMILKDPAQGVVVAELAGSSVNLATRPFCKSEHYWDVYFYMQENVKKQFDAKGISIPYPQMDVHQIS